MILRRTPVKQVEGLIDRPCELQTSASTGVKTPSGKGGIRTLGTGVNRYNGLANSTRPLPIARSQSDTIISDVPSRAESGCSALCMHLNLHLVQRL